MKKLTIFYNKRTGSIKELCTGIQSMDWFGDEKEDYKEIFDFIVVDYDEYIIQNLHQFEIKNNKVVLKNTSNINKYLQEV